MAPARPRSSLRRKTLAIIASTTMGLVAILYLPARAAFVGGPVEACSAARRAR